MTNVWLVTMKKKESTNYQKGNKARRATTLSLAVVKAELKWTKR